VCKWRVIRKRYFGEEVRLLTENEEKAKGVQNSVQRSGNLRVSGRRVAGRVDQERQEFDPAVWGVQVDGAAAAGKRAG
jgi:hypothetical protein